MHISDPTRLGHLKMRRSSTLGMINSQMARGCCCGTVRGRPTLRVSLSRVLGSLLLRLLFLDTCLERVFTSPMYVFLTVTIEHTNDNLGFIDDVQVCGLLLPTVRSLSVSS